VYIMDKGTEILVLMSPISTYLDQVIKPLPATSSSVVLQPEFNTDEFIGWNAFHLVELLQKGRATSVEVPVFAVYLGDQTISQALRHHLFTSLLQSADGVTRITGGNTVKVQLQAKFQEFLQAVHEKSLNSKTTF